MRILLKQGYRPDACCGISSHRYSQTPLLSCSAACTRTLPKLVTCHEATCHCFYKALINLGTESAQGILGWSSHIYYSQRCRERGVCNHPVHLIKWVHAWVMLCCQGLASTKAGSTHDLAGAGAHPTLVLGSGLGLHFFEGRLSISSQ